MKEYRTHFNTPVMAVGVWRGDRRVRESKESRLHTEDFCGHNVFALNPPKTSCRLRKPFNVIFLRTALTQLWMTWFYESDLGVLGLGL